jgi:hypothetical protein
MLPRIKNIMKIDVKKITFIYQPKYDEKKINELIEKIKKYDEYSELNKSKDIVYKPIEK